MKMKKLVYLFACTALFAACSSDDSKTSEGDMPPTEFKSIKNKVVFSTFDHEKRVSNLYELDPTDGKYVKIKEFKEDKLADLQSISFDPVNKKLYAISSEKQLLKFDLEKRETVFIKTLTPSFDVEIEQSFFDKRGQMFTFGYGTGNPLQFNNFILIDKESTKATKEDSSKELKKMLVGSSISFNVYDENQDRIVSLYEKYNTKESTTSFSLLTLNPTNFAEFDAQKEKNTIAIKQLNYISVALGLVVDKNQNYYLSYALDEEDTVAQIDPKTGELQGMFSLYIIYEMMYDKHTNSIYIFTEDRQEKLHFVTYNIDTKQMKSFELKDIQFEIFGSTFID